MQHKVNRNHTYHAWPWLRPVSSIKHAFPQLISPHVVHRILHNRLKVHLQPLNVLVDQPAIQHQLGGRGGLEEWVQAQLHAVFLHTQVELALYHSRVVWTQGRLCREAAMEGTLTRGVACESRKPVILVDKKKIEDQMQAVCAVRQVAECNDLNHVVLLAILQQSGELGGGGGPEMLRRDVDEETHILCHRGANVGRRAEVHSLHAKDI